MHFLCSCAPCTGSAYGSMAFKNEIAAVRKRRGMSQGDLAARVGATLSMIGKLERGERKLTTEWLDKISIALQTFPKNLLSDENDPTQIAEVQGNGHVRFTGSLDIFAGRDATEVDHQAFQGFESPKLCSAAVKDDPVSIALPVGAELVFSLNDMRDREPRLGSLAIINIVRQDASDIRLGVLLQGTQPGKYHVLSTSGEFEQDVRIHWAMQVIAINLP